MSNFEQNTNQDNTKDTKEVDLKFLTNRIKFLFDSIGFSIFRFVRFMLRNYIIVAFLIVLGVGLGFFIDIIKKNNFEHKVLVVPNFNSVDYLYDHVENQNKLSTNKPLYKKYINSISIEPVKDLYNFLGESRENLKIFDALSKVSSFDLEKFQKQNSTNRNYKYQLLVFKTKNLSSDSTNYIIDKFLGDLNNDTYYNEKRKVEYNNLLLKKEELNKSIAQINNFFTNLGIENNSSNVSLNTYNQLNDMLESKQSLLQELNNLDIQLIEKRKVIYESYRIMNIKNNMISNKVILPVFFIFLLIVFVWIRKKINEYKLM